MYTTVDACTFGVFFRRWTVSLKLSARYITWQRHLTCTVKETFEDTLVCLGLRRIVTVAFLRRVQIFLLTYFAYLLTSDLKASFVNAYS